MFGMVASVVILGLIFYAYNHKVKKELKLNRKREELENARIEQEIKQMDAEIDSIKNKD